MLPPITDPNVQWSAAYVNLPAVWDEYRGAGTTVAVVDDGFDTTHTELAANYNTAIDYDYNDNDTDPQFGSADKHGTAVMGVIGADDNGSGIVGVACDADITGFRVPFVIGSMNTFGTAVIAAGAAADVVSSSWSWGPFFDNWTDPSMATAATALDTNAATGRGGLGTLTVFSSGNTRTLGDSSNYSDWKNSPYAITVANVQSTGIYASASNPGSTNFVSAPGQNVTTTDNTGSAGFGSGDLVTVSGTSVAAPVVTGVVALMLEANAGLGYRDIQDILAHTATKTDAGNAAWQTNVGTHHNGGGLHFNTNYGFGVVDALAAVRLAETWTETSTTANLTTTTASAAPAAAIPDNSTTGVTSTFSIATALDIEHVELNFDIDHTRHKDLTITLTSPSGTVSQMIAKPDGGPNGALDFTTMSNAFRGENSVGTWTVKIVDSASGSTGTINDWSMKILGSNNLTNDNYVFTNEYASAVTITDADMGTDVINASAVTGNSTIDLNTGIAGSIGGTAFTVGNTGIERAFSGDGNDNLIGNSKANDLHGGRGSDFLKGDSGNDTLFGDAGTDELYGGAGKDDMTGGAGADQFYFNGTGQSVVGANADWILDFSIADLDLIDLFDMDANSTVGGNQNFSFTGTSAFSAAAQIRYDQTATDTLVFGDVNGDAVADFQINLAGLHTLTASNFLL